jgi:hypothetical protein
MMETPMPLLDKLVLLIEPDDFLAGYIADGLHRAGAHILGPSRSVEEANGLVARVRTAPDAAVISVDIFEAAGFVAGEALAQMSVPILLIAGRTRTLTPARDRHPVLTTPFAAYQIVDHVCAVLSPTATETKTKGPTLRGH